MPARKNYSIWDEVWLAETDATRARVGFPARLSGGLTRLEKWRRWWRRFRHLAIVTGVLFLGVFVLLAVLLGIWTDAAQVLVVACVLMPMFVWLMEAGSCADGRVVAASRVRCRIVRDERKRGEEVAARCAYWRERLESGGFGEIEKRLMRRSVWWQLATCAYFGLFFGGVFWAETLAKFLPWFSSPSVFLIVGGSLGFSWSGSAIRKHLKGRLVASAAQKACGDCGYLLEAGGEGIGPARCSECGSPWPLVPPPIPGRGW